MAVWVSVLYWAIFCHYFGQVSGIFLPLREYSGSTFFDAWDFYGNIDNTTWGNVTYQDRTNATSKKLAFTNEAGNAIVKVDNTTNIASAEVVSRDSIRLTSQDAYDLGTLLVIDVLHIPYGCSVWPSFWTLGANELWPLAGEIDLIEAINLMPGNQVALHTTPGCFQALNSLQLGSSLENNCSTDQGCIVQETKPNSFGEGFAHAGGGVFAMQLDVTGIFTWFFGRADIPENIRSATSASPMDISQWGTPSSSYPASGCNITEFFGPQQLVLLTTLCGVWAGVPSIYKDTCHTPTNSCVNDNVVGPGSNYDNAYWEISYIRAYQAQGNDSFHNLTATSASAVPESTRVISQTVAQALTLKAPTPLTTKLPSTTPTTSGSTRSFISSRQVLTTIIFLAFFWDFLC